MVGERSRAEVVKTIFDTACWDEVSLLTAWAAVAAGAEISAEAAFVFALGEPALPVLLAVGVAAMYDRESNLPAYENFAEAMSALTNPYGLASVLPSVLLSPPSKPLLLANLTATLGGVYSASGAEASAIERGVELIHSTLESRETVERIATGIDYLFHHSTTGTLATSPTSAGTSDSAPYDDHSRLPSEDPMDWGPGDGEISSFGEAGDYETSGGPVMMMFIQLDPQTGELALPPDSGAPPPEQGEISNQQDQESDSRQETSPDMGGSSSNSGNTDNEGEVPSPGQGEIGGGGGDNEGGGGDE
ncbi:hypothetical protein C2I33_16725 [Ralstonia solanacearum]|uniref:hypothetical protein n=1 Tax=Ralstonia solanacearum TaxID=305 RepID=UPI0001816667|nr:hypothetical protein [Ralstonia solanacearum]MDC6177164.1 hypothetical protein [Ralstonia solanacearum]MDC6210277.1 hypothetical protein [Ralstonia solanacearum]MDC6241700.1 hypothetical protein [Ralstonia solanacearum]MDD7799643.1 hypothetical protein [Ralstonia solanacearum]TYZ53868.1 hypothetical protein C2I33_16725 [Ralstonia solanacearum]